MSQPVIKEKAIAYEALSFFYNVDRDKAWIVLLSFTLSSSSSITENGILSLEKASLVFLHISLNSASSLKEEVNSRV